MNQKTPQELFEDMTAELTAFRREINAKVMTKEQAKQLQNSLDEWGRNAMQTMIDLNHANIDIETQALHIATEASRSAITSQMRDMRSEVLKAAQAHSEAAGQARKMAWQYFGGFWVWITSMLLLGIIIGIIGFWLASNARSARDFGKNPSFLCQLAGGTKGTQDDGRKYCVFWLE